jgi:hypothetical protein
MTIEEDWDAHIEEYSINYPFGDLKAIELDKDDVNSELIDKCIDNYVISEVSNGYVITHEDIEQHLEVINEHGMEAYLQKRLEVVNEQQ